MFHSVLFVVPYPPNIAPSQRFRFEQYLDILKERNYKVTVKPFIPQLQYEALYYGKNPVKNAFILLGAIFKRLLLLTQVSKFDFIFIHREAMPVGPPVFEWVTAKFLRKKIIYDFDDAIWLTDNLSESRFMRLARYRLKVRSICRWSYKVSAGNQYLANFALAYNQNVIVNPTTIDTTMVHNPALFPSKEELKKENAIKGPVIGWTGSRSTLKYLESLFPVIEKLQNKFPGLVLVVIADRPPGTPLKNLVFKKWSQATEAKDLLIMDVGIMPLPDDEWTKGKCGFKALQYMAMGIPAAVSPVGVNTTIIHDGENGFLCSSEKEWMAGLSKLVSNEELRETIGRNGRQTVYQRYSAAANTTKFLSLFH